MSESIHPPYPADTKAKGWRFEIDMEKVEASDTWLRAKTGALRGALLLLWAKSWQQVPCGSLPNDDELVALLIDMPAATFAKHRAVLMRGWSLTTDGRLYHETITNRVLAMLDKRATDAERAARNRAKRAESSVSPPEVTPASRVTNAGLRSEFDTKHQAPDTSNTKTPLPPCGDKPPKRARGQKVPLPQWIETIKAQGEKPIQPDDPIFAYAQEIGLPEDFLHLAWREFLSKHSEPNGAKQIDWRAHFRNTVKANWLRLWWVNSANGGAYELTTAGHQARLAFEAKQNQTRDAA